MKKHKTIILVALFLVLVVGLNSLFNFLLVQPGLSQTIFYETKQGGYDCVVLGASHGSYGIATDVLSEKLGVKTMNMCMGGEYMRDAYHELKYAMKYNDLKTVVLDIDYQYLVNYHEESILHNSIYNAFPNGLDKLEYYKDKILAEDYRGTFLRWTNFWQCYYMIPKTVKKKTSQAYKECDPSVTSMNKNDTYKGNGFIYRSKDAKKGKSDAISWNQSSVSSSEVSFVNKIIDLCKDNNIQIFLTSIAVDPVSVAKNPDNYKGAHDYIKKIADKKAVPYYDFNYANFDKYSRSTEDFWDMEGHMYGDTAEKFSAVYGEVLYQAVHGTLNESEYFGTDLKSIYASVQVPKQ